MYKLWDINRKQNTSIYYLYRYPSSSKDEFHDFLTTLELNLDDSVNSNAFLTTAIGYAVVRSYSDLILPETDVAELLK